MLRSWKSCQILCFHRILAEHFTSGLLSILFHLDSILLGQNLPKSHIGFLFNKWNIRENLVNIVGGSVQYKEKQ